jgi:CheY-like chemotaxis protein
VKRRAPKERIGDILLRSAVVDSAQLERALDRQKIQPGRLGSQLLDLGFVTEDDLAKALSIQHRVPPFLPSLASVDPAAVERLPRSLALRLKTLPVAWDPDRGLLYVAVAHPSDLSAVDEVRFASGARRVAVQVAPEHVIDRLLARHYDGVQTQPIFLPEVSVAPTTAPVENAGRRRQRRGQILVVDPEPRRRRALATLFDACGFSTTRTGTPEEAGAHLDKVEWTAVWIHRSLANELSHPSARLYEDPARVLDEGVTLGGAIAVEAAALAEEAALLILADEMETPRQAVSLIQFLAGRQGVGGPALQCLELRAWRAALAGWQIPEDPPSLPGEEVLGAVAAYQRALLADLSPAAAAEAVRSDPSLDPDAVTSLLRWAVGVDLLRRIEAPRRVLALFPPISEPEGILIHLEQAGWVVERSEDPARAADFDVVLAALETGLALLEKLPKTPGAENPPVFLVTSGASEPDTMYALRLGAEDVFTPETHPEVAETKLQRAAARWRRDREFVAGNLRDMGLADLLQVLSNGLKTASIWIDGPHGEAEVAVQEGRIVDARTGDLEGEEALYGMVGWEEGTFRIETGTRARAVTIQGSTEGLLMEGFRRLDEARRRLDDVPELG